MNVYRNTTNTALARPAPAAPRALHIDRVDDPDAALMVTDPVARRYLEPLLERERSASELARVVGVPLSTAVYRIKRLVRTGLVEQTRCAPRGGRPIRYYRAVADGFFVPFDATPLETVESLAPDVFRPWSDVLAANIAQAWLEASGDRGAFGFRLALDERGVIQRDVVPVDAPTGAPTEPRRFFEALLAPEAPAVWDTWGTLALLPGDAKALQREVALLLSRYRCRERAGARQHLVRLAMAPIVVRP